MGFLGWAFLLERKSCVQTDNLEGCQTVNHVEDFKVSQIRKQQRRKLTGNLIRSYFNRAIIMRSLGGGIGTTPSLGYKGGGGGRLGGKSSNSSMAISLQFVICSCWESSIPLLRQDCLSQKLDLSSAHDYS